MRCCRIDVGVEQPYNGRDRRAEQGRADVLPVRLTRKYAEMIDDIDLSERNVGDRLPLPPRDAHVLVAEGWAEPARARERRERD
jgi:hypothetical protein